MKINSNDTVIENPQYYLLVIYDNLLFKWFFINYIINHIEIIESQIKVIL